MKHVFAASSYTSAGTRRDNGRNASVAAFSGPASHEHAGRAVGAGAVKGSWPKVTARITLRFTATHSLPDIGVAEPHPHEWIVAAGYTHEINPHHGCTKPMQSMRQELEGWLSRLDGKHLNDVLPFPPTSETIACWIMAHLPEYWDTVAVESYDGYRVEVRADNMRSEWLRQYRA